MIAAARAVRQGFEAAGGEILTVPEMNLT